MTVTPIRVGPLFIADTVENLYTPDGGVSSVRVRRIRVVNLTNTQKQFSLYLAATTQDDVLETALYKDFQIGGNGIVIEDCDLVMQTSEFITGYASVTGELSIVFEVDEVVD